jgi:hypothetical protein
MAMLIRAGVANQRGDEATAVQLAEQSLKEFEAIKMRLYAVAAGRRLGEMIGGDRGRDLIAKTDRWMIKQQIKNPQKIMNLLAPGWRN